MSDETLRRAAALMRKNAAAATSPPWAVENAPSGFPAMVVGSGMVVADTYDKPHLSDGRHIAAWSPDVATGMADLFDALADRIERRPSFGLTDPGATAVVAALAYLQETP